MKKIRTDLSRVSSIDWARLAAFIDGEGCISVKATYARALKDSPLPGLILRVHIATTDPRLTCWLIGVFGGAVDECRSVTATNPRWRKRLDWVVYSHDAAAVIRGCQPYLLLKRQQAEVALAFQATVRPHGSHERLAEQTIATRHSLRADMRALNKKGPRDLAVASGE